MTHTAGNRGSLPREKVSNGSTSGADVEYSIMLAVLNFQKDFMQSNYSHIQVRFVKNTIEVDLTRTSPIPAEERLAQTQEGCIQLREMHQALFATGQDRLQKELTEILGEHIYELRTDLDPPTGKSTMVINLLGASEHSIK
ncbi:Na-translocating system protein MpsC family protein [Nitrospira lenta]|uniref:Na+-translocating membrane potential-generating system MpsC domain-containing protein n=1 Tax=Nitrospira lenta TaxID=1436998 RepID=A0A330L8D2_9BACT|nr:Na-translocating system protein MpsC family protein [Nitrospira lenta]SPP65964.1 conserved hypothetical protein [Nitrospira lenta]